MKNMNFDASLERMKELINVGSSDAKLKPNVSETIENKMEAADGKTYGIVRECQRYFIKEAKADGSYEYIGGIGNKSENEHPSYNSAFRNLELKVRSINEALDSKKIVESFKPAQQAEYIVEATVEMRNELDRFKQVVNGANKIMNEEKTEFITKPTFKDPEGFGTASDPKKQGAPFEKEPGEFKGDIDPKSSSKTAKNAGDPFEKEVKPAPEKMDIEKTNKKPSEAGKFGGPAENVPANSVANQNPKGGKVFKVTEDQFKKAQKLIKEGYFDDDFGGNEFGGDEYGEDSIISDRLNRLDRQNQKLVPNLNTIDRGINPLAASRPGVDLDLGSDDMDDTYDMPMDNIEFEDPDPTLDNTGIDLGDDELYNEEITEGFMDNLKAAGNVGKYFGNKASQGAQNLGNKAVQGAKNIGNKAVQGAKNIGNNIKQGAQNVANDASQQWNKSQQNSSAGKIQQIATSLKSEIDNLNARTVKAGGQPIKYSSVIATISNQLRGSKGVDTSRYRSESVEQEPDENLVNEITEAVLNVFGQHPTYQKPAFTTPASNGSLVAGTKEWDDESTKGDKPYGQKIGSSAPFTEPVKQKVGEGEIGGDSDSVMKGETQQSKPKLGQKGDVKPFKKPVENSGDKIAKGTPVQKGETQQGEPKLGQKGDVQPFGKKTNKEGVKESKEEMLRRLTESIVNDLKKK